MAIVVTVLVKLVLSDHMWALKLKKVASYYSQPLYEGQINSKVFFLDPTKWSL